jgi:hypothetical protein
MPISNLITVPEIIDPVFEKTSLKRSFSMTEYERFGLDFTKTRVYKFGHRSNSKTSGDTYFLLELFIFVKIFEFCLVTQSI